MKASESIAQLVQHQPSKREVGRLLPTEHLALRGTCIVSDSAFFEFSLSAVDGLGLVGLCIDGDW